MVKLKINLPDGFLEEEYRDGYLVSSQMKKVWAVELDLLVEFMRVCEKYHIKWYADAGTILGAARHKGMIPWDDDIDVMMMRHEYDRFIKLCSKDFKYPYYLQSGYETCHCHLQLRNSETTGILKHNINDRYNFNQGIFLDIFPIDNKIDDDKLFSEQCSSIEKLKLMASQYRLLKGSRQYKSQVKRFLFKNLLKKSFEIVTNSTPLIYSIDSIASKYNDIESDEVCKLILPPFTKRRIWKKKWFDDTCYLPFEFLTIPVPSGYKELIDTFYGNWEEYVIGTSSHGSTFFDVDKPYNEYIK